MLADEKLATKTKTNRKLQHEIVVQKSVISKLTADRAVCTQARKIAKARNQRLEQTGNEYEYKIQTKAIEQADLSATHQGLQEYMVMKKQN